MLTINPEVDSLIRQGLFRDALKQLGSVSSIAQRRPEFDVVAADLNERLGKHGVARAMAERILRSRTAPAAHRSAAEYTLARLLSDEGITEEAVRRYQRAASLADEAGDLERVCWAKLRLLNILAEQSTPDATSALLNEVRLVAARTGNRQTLAAVHLYAGETEIKRGLLKAGRRHTRVALGLLEGASNLWLKAIAENTLLAISVISHDFEDGLQHGDTALKCAEESGAAATIRACLGNLGNLNFIVGQLDQAITYFELYRTRFPRQDFCLS